MVAAKASSNRRAVVLVIDACGAGALPDAAQYGDEGTNTLAHVAQAVGGLRLPVLERLGLGSILPLAGLSRSPQPIVHGRLHALGPGKDSIAGHWELMGIVTERLLPTFGGEIGPDVLQLVRDACGHGTICNGAYNGIAAIEDFGAEHLRTGELVVYTSQDSVIQLAAHVERLPPRELYRACESVRAAMSGELAVGRVIARPFCGREGAFRRTPGRRDYALAPPGRSYLLELQERGSQVHAVGKIADLFCQVGISASHPGSSNAEALQTTSALLDELPDGLIFVNLIETDQLHGHRKDTHGFHEALRQIDAAVGSWAGRLASDDLLILTADHGVDPNHPGTDHTREHVPLLAGDGKMLQVALHGARRGPVRLAHEGPLADVGATVLQWLTGSQSDSLPGQPLLTRQDG